METNLFEAKKAVDAPLHVSICLPPRKISLENAHGHRNLFSAFGLSEKHPKKSLAKKRVY